MKTWISIPLTVLTAILSSCGSEENNETINDKEHQKQKDLVIDLEKKSETLLKEKAECGFANNSLKDRE